MRSYRTRRFFFVVLPWSALGESGEFNLAFLDATKAAITTALTQ